MLNVFTEPAHRGRGLATRLVQHILSWCKETERLGFAASNEMQLDF